MALGMTDGTNYIGTVSSWGNNGHGILDTLVRGTVNSYGVSVGNNDTSQLESANKTLGVTMDPTKSGIVASLSDINIGTINSLKLGKYILKY